MVGGGANNVTMVVVGLSDGNGTSMGVLAVSMWVELILQESLDLWHDIGDVSAMEVSVASNVRNDLIVSSSEDSLSGLNKWSEHDPVVFVKSLELEREMFKGSVPVSHKEIVVSLESESPFVDGHSVKDEHEIVVNAVSALFLSGNNIDVLSSCVCGHNFLFTDDFHAIDCLVLLGKGKGGDEGKGSAEFHFDA